MERGLGMMPHRCICTRTWALCLGQEGGNSAADTPTFDYHWSLVQGRRQSIPGTVVWSSLRTSVPSSNNLFICTKRSDNNIGHTLMSLSQETLWQHRPLSFYTNIHVSFCMCAPVCAHVCRSTSICVKVQVDDTEHHKSPSTNTHTVKKKRQDIFFFLCIGCLNKMPPSLHV